MKDITIADIFKYRKEAYLVAKMTGTEKADRFDETLDKLRKDLGIAYKDYYAYRQEKRDPAYSTNWALSLDEFCALAPYYKAFANATREKLRDLLLSERRRVGGLKQTDKARFYKRDERVGSWKTATWKDWQVIPCLNPERLTPLESKIYDYIATAIILRRLGLTATRTSNFSHRGDDIQIFIGRGKNGKHRIVLNYKSKAVETREDWLKIFRREEQRYQLADNHRLSDKDLLATTGRITQFRGYR